jgi:hypothetical protein
MQGRKEKRKKEKNRGREGGRRERSEECSM